YGAGESERLVGRVLKGERERVAIATKVGPRDDPRASLEDSLRRLGTDYVDLVQLHETLERWEWQLEKLHALQLAGKALAVGLCNATHGQLERALTIAPLATYQAPYSLFDRDVEERDLPLCRARGLAFLAYRPLAAGLLTGKYEAPPQFGDAARTWGERERFIAARLDGTTRYEAIAAEWTDRGDQPMSAAQVKVFVDQLVEQGLVD